MKKAGISILIAIALLLSLGTLVALGADSNALACTGSGTLTNCQTIGATPCIGANCAKLSNTACSLSDWLTGLIINCQTGCQSSTGNTCIKGTALAAKLSDWAKTNADSVQCVNTGTKKGTSSAPCGNSSSPSANNDPSGNSQCNDGSCSGSQCQDDDTCADDNCSSNCAFCGSQCNDGSSSCDQCDDDCVCGNCNYSGNCLTWNKWFSGFCYNGQWYGHVTCWKDQTPGDDEDGSDVTPPDGSNDDSAAGDQDDDNGSDTGNQGGDSGTPTGNQDGNSDTSTTPSADTSVSAFAQEVFRLTNAERVKNGLSELTQFSALNQAAAVRGKEQATLYSHTRPDGSQCFTVLAQFGISYSSAGENIAMGYTTPESVVNGWMNSAGHRANILNANFTSLGVGFYQGSDGTMYWAQEFIGE